MRSETPRRAVNRDSSRLRPIAAFCFLMGAALACGLPAPSAAPEEVIIEPTVRPILSEAALATLSAPTAPAQPTAPEAASPPASSGPGQVVLRQPFAIVIAYSGPQTGQGNVLFTPLQQAVQKAIEDHGPVHGYGVNLVSFDDQCSQDGGANTANQIVADANLVAVLGPVCSKAAQGALPILENANVVMISGSATIPGLSAYGQDVFHRTLLDDDAVTLEAGQQSQVYILQLPSVQSWLRDFEAWGGQILEERLNFYSAHQYDAAGILLQALDQVAAPQPDGSLLIDREALRAAVHGTATYSGVTGPITFEADGDRAP